MSCHTVVIIPCHTTIHKWHTDLIFSTLRSWYSRITWSCFKVFPIGYICERTCKFTYRNCIKNTTQKLGNILSLILWCPCSCFPILHIYISGTPNASDTRWCWKRNKISSCLGQIQTNHEQGWRSWGIWTLLLQEQNISDVAPRLSSSNTNCIHSIPWSAQSLGVTFYPP
jgi:hypothetical protein